MAHHLQDNNQTAPSAQHQNQPEANGHHYALLLDNLQSGVVHYETADNGQTFIIRDMNPASERIEQISHDQAVGRRVDEVFPGVSEFGLLDIMREVWRSGEPASHPLSLYQDGRIKSWRENRIFKTGPNEIVAVYNDVTRHIQSLEASIEANNARSRFELAIEQSGETIMIASKDGLIEYVNPAFVTTSKFESSEAIGRKLDFNAELPGNIIQREQIWEKIAQGKAWSGQLTSLRKDAIPFEEEVTLSPVRNNRHDLINFVIVKRDVSQEIKLRFQLQKAQKMEAIGQLAGGISHDFNNLLQIIFAHIQFSRRTLEKEHPARHDIDEISRAAEKAASLTRQLLAFGRRQMLQPVDLNLNTLISDLLKMLRRIISENIELDFIPGHQLGTVRADPVQVEQVIMNLCINARDAMPDGGRITLETENVLVNGNYTEIHPWAQPGRYVLLSVTDTGAGMSPEVRDRVFEPFFSTKPKDKGTGLGLATVYGIVKQHGGFIHVYSEPDRGSMFKIYLKLIERQASDVGEEIMERPPGGAETILLVEDSKPVRAVTKKLLVHAGYNVLEAANGRIALDAIKNDETRDIDLVLMDVVMPQMGGPESARAMQKVRPGVPLIFTSGYSPGGDQLSQLLKENIPLVQKPFDPDTLLRKVRDVLDSHRDKA